MTTNALFQHTYLVTGNKTITFYFTDIVTVTGITAASNSLSGTLDLTPFTALIAANFAVNNYLEVDIDPVITYLDTRKTDLTQGIYDFRSLGFNYNGADAEFLLAAAINASGTYTMNILLTTNILVLEDGSTSFVLEDGFTELSLEG